MQGGRVMDSVGRPQNLQGLGLNKLGESALSTRRGPRARMVTPSSTLQRPPSTLPPGRQVERAGTQRRWQRRPGRPRTRQRRLGKGNPASLPFSLAHPHLLALL